MGLLKAFDEEMNIEKMQKIYDKHKIPRLLERESKNFQELHRELGEKIDELERGGSISEKDDRSFMEYSSDSSDEETEGEFRERLMKKKRSEKAKRGATQRLRMNFQKDPYEDDDEDEDEDEFTQPEPEPSQKSRWRLCCGLLKNKQKKKHTKKKKKKNTKQKRKKHTKKGKRKKKNTKQKKNTKRRRR